MIDGLAYFSKRLNAVIGMNMSRLFGLDNVSLRRAEIYINNSKGINCSFDFSKSTKWPLGKYIVDELKIVRDNVEYFLKLLQLLILKKNYFIRFITTD